MSKTIPSGLEAHYQEPAQTVAKCLLVTRADGEVFAFTECSKPLTILDQVYEPGARVMAIVTAAGLAGGNLEIATPYDDTFVREDFIAGKWANAQWELFEVNWKSIVDGTNTIATYVTADVKPYEAIVTIELMTRRAYLLKQSIGQVTQKSCRARFADYPSQVADARCGLDAADFLVEGEVTAVTNQQVFTDSARTEPDDWFGEGVLRWLTGENAGLSQKVKSFASDVFTLSLPMPFAIGVGDTYEVIAGCRGRLTEDCRDKHDNVLNFQGEPHLPGPDAALASPTVDV